MNETFVLTATVRGVTVKTWLYGPVDETRYQREYQMVHHRAAQLAPEVPKPPRRTRDNDDALGYLVDLGRG
jgi:hypothetical protein